MINGLDGALELFILHVLHKCTSLLTIQGPFLYLTHSVIVAINAHSVLQNAFIPFLLCNLDFAEQKVLHLLSKKEPLHQIEVEKVNFYRRSGDCLLPHFIEMGMRIHVLLVSFYYYPSGLKAMTFRGLQEIYLEYFCAVDLVAFVERHQGLHEIFLNCEFRCINHVSFSTALPIQDIPIG